MQAVKVPQSKYKLGFVRVFFTRRCNECQVLLLQLV